MNIFSALLCSAAGIVTLVACGSGIIAPPVDTGGDDYSGDNGNGNATSTSPVPSTTSTAAAKTKTCSDLRACCAGQTDASLKMQCDALVAATSNNESSCNALYASLKKNGNCP